jgi:sugar phosphate isomerase/epimerase
VETGTEPGAVLRAVLDSFDTAGLAASIDPAALLQNGIDPALTVRQLGPWVAHAYAHDVTTAPATASTGRFTPLTGSGFPAGVLNWEEYLGALEEIHYRGFLTIWPDPSRPPEPQFKAIIERLERF